MCAGGQFEDLFRELQDPSIDELTDSISPKRELDFEIKLKTYERPLSDLLYTYPELRWKKL